MVVLATIISGAAGYYTLGHFGHRGWSFFDCVYFTVISLTTVGYGETLPGFSHDRAARGYTIGLLIVGYTVMVWAVSSIIAVFVEGHLSEYIGRARMMNEIERLTGHHIVCGAGETGYHVTEELCRTGHDVVLVDLDSERLAGVRESLGCLVMEGDAESEATLLAAGIKRARGFVACMREDKDNIYLVLSARQLNAELRIVARAMHLASREKLARAGADVVVSPNYIGGLRIASEMVRPSVTTFLDLMMRDRTQINRIEEVVLSPSSRLAGLALKEAEVTRQTGLLVLATRAADDDQFRFNPRPDDLLTPGMTLIVLGEVGGVQRLRDLAEG